MPDLWSHRTDAAEFELSVLKREYAQLAPPLNLEEVEKLIQSYLSNENYILKMIGKRDLNVDREASIYRDKIGYTLEQLEQFKNGKG